MNNDTDDVAVVQRFYCKISHNEIDKISFMCHYHDNHWNHLVKFVIIQLYYFELIIFQNIFDVNLINVVIIIHYYYYFHIVQTKIILLKCLNETFWRFNFIIKLYNKDDLSMKYFSNKCDVISVLSNQNYFRQFLLLESYMIQINIIEHSKSLKIRWKAYKTIRSTFKKYT